MSESKEDQKMSSHSSNAKPLSSTDNTNRFLMGAAVVQVLLLAVIAFQLSGLDNALTGGAVVAPSPSAGPDALPTVPSDMKSLIDDDSVLGDKNAPVTIVEWSDYECPFCARFHSETFGQIKSKYIDTGKVKFVYRDFPLSFHQNAQPAAEAAECAGEQNKYWEMHNLLFTQGVQGGVASFKQFAKQIGLNTATFNTCLDTGKMKAEIQKDFADGQKVGIQGTPGFVVNGQLISGAQPFSVFQQVIDAELAK